MPNNACRNCKLRARYDANPKSLLGRFWRWHTGWCPGWRSHMKSLPEVERRALAEKYGMTKFL